MTEGYSEKGPVIIIPAYCPDFKLLKLVEQIRELSQLPIVIVDDGSGADYREAFHQLNKIEKCTVYHHDVNKGKGAALKKGVKIAAGKYPKNIGYITADADGQHEPCDILIIALLLSQTNSKIIMGKRDFSEAGVPLRSRAGNKISSLMFYLATGVKCADTQNGLRGIPRELEGEFLNTSGRRYDFEMNFLLKMAREKAEIVYVPINTVYLEDNKSSHFHAVKDSLIVFSGIAKFLGSSILSAAVDLSLFTILNSSIFKGAALTILLSTIIARCCSGMLNFLLNQKIVFKGTGKLSEAFKYGVLFVSQMIISGLMVGLFSKIFRYTTIVKMFVDSILFFVSYFVQKNLVFGQELKERKI